ncbi:uncharacterized protein DEA37_0010425 [Paragonimus westermani]|uniref:Uncharacterized protein n=1 Tax=Paragonimus westermani TaxID=34504 RepID=A0A5J4NTV3_9TREM|nr:uncharacterized protein DEA37_0010425 [Paragonimus westermani]
MQEISSAVQEPLSYWDQFREIWELPKDDFIQRYRQLNPHVSSIDADIASPFISHSAVSPPLNCTRVNRGFFLTSYMSGSVDALITFLVDSVPDSRYHGVHSV